MGSLACCGRPASSAFPDLLTMLFSHEKSPELPAAAPALLRTALPSISLVGKSASSIAVLGASALWALPKPWSACGMPAALSTPA